MTLPNIVARAARVLSTSDDSTTVDRIISVAGLVFVATLLTPVVTHVVPVLPAFLATPLTAGLVNELATYLAASGDEE